MTKNTQKPSEENVTICFMEDPKDIMASEDKAIRWYKNERWIVRISTHGKRLSDLLNEPDIFLEYKNNLWDLITINKSAILFIILDGEKTPEQIKYDSAELEIYFKRWLKCIWKINTEWRVNYKQALEKRWFVPVDTKKEETYKTIIANRDNIMRIIEHKPA